MMRRTFGEGPAEKNNMQKEPAESWRWFGRHDGSGRLKVFKSPLPCAYYNPLVLSGESLISIAAVEIGRSPNWAATPPPADCLLSIEPSASFRNVLIMQAVF